MTTADSTPTTALEVRHLHANDEAYLPALRLVLGVATDHASNQEDDAVSELLESIDGSSTELGFVLAAFENGRVVDACALVSSPGHSGLVMLPPVMPTEPTATLLSVQAREAWSKGVRLLEILTKPGDKSAEKVFTRAGYRRLTTLLYLRKRLNGTTPPPCHDELTWATFSEETEPLFRQAISESYEQSLDCPELSDLRSVEDAIAGHRATGDFDPSLWWVAMRQGVPVGLILLSKIRSRPVVELVYMGVSATARGTGIGNALLAQGFHYSSRIGASTVALAVDQRNHPALDLYLRSGFIEVGLRDAWIASPDKENTSSREQNS